MLFRRLVAYHKRNIVVLPLSRPYIKQAELFLYYICIFILLMNHVDSIHWLFVSLSIRSNHIFTFRTCFLIVWTLLCRYSKNKQACAYQQLGWSRDIFRSNSVNEVAYNNHYVPQHRCRAAHPVVGFLQSLICGSNAPRGEGESRLGSVPPEDWICIKVQEFFTGILLAPHHEKLSMKDTVYNVQVTFSLDELARSLGYEMNLTMFPNLPLHDDGWPTKVEVFWTLLGPI